MVGVGGLTCVAAALSLGDVTSQTDPRCPATPTVQSRLDQRPCLLVGCTCLSHFPAGSLLHAELVMNRRKMASSLRQSTESLTALRMCFSLSLPLLLRSKIKLKY